MHPSILSYYRINSRRGVQYEKGFTIYLWYPFLISCKGSIKLVFKHLQGSRGRCTPTVGRGQSLTAKGGGSAPLGLSPRSKSAERAQQARIPSDKHNRHQGRTQEGPHQNTFGENNPWFPLLELRPLFMQWATVPCILHGYALVYNIIRLNAN